MLVAETEAAIVHLTIALSQFRCATPRRTESALYEFAKRVRGLWTYPEGAAGFDRTASKISLARIGNAVLWKSWSAM